MASPTATQVMDEARKVYLNDSSGALYSDATLLPHLLAAYDELQQEIELNGNASLQEISSAITVNSGSVTVTLPSDFIKPIKLQERAIGQDDSRWIDMTELEWEPTLERSRELRYWNFREDEIKLLGATENRQVRLFYWKVLPTVTSGANSVLVTNSKRFLALKAASTAATFIGQNPILGDRLELRAYQALDKLMANGIRSRQGMPVRRRGFRAVPQKGQFYITN